MKVARGRSLERMAVLASADVSPIVTECAAKAPTRGGGFVEPFACAPTRLRELIESAMISVSNACAWSVQQLYPMSWVTGRAKPVSAD
jgi:hypothetical protein